MHTMIRASVLAAVFLVAQLGSAHAGLIVNGGFESGFTGWTKADQLGSDGTFFLQSGSLSPLNGDEVAAPPEGEWAAMTDSGAAGSHVLYQDFVVPSTLSAVAQLSFQLFIADRSSFGFFSPSTLDFNTLSINQQVRVDLMSSTSNAFSVGTGDVLANLYQSKSDDVVVSEYIAFEFNVTALLNANLGKTLRLRFAEVDNSNGALQFGVDAVSLDARPVPEPSTLATAGLAVVIAAASVRRRGRSNSRA